MKLKFKSFAKNALMIFAVVFLAAGCANGAGDNVSEDKYDFDTPTFKAGDLYCLSGVSNDGTEYNYYCFESSTSGSIVAYKSKSSDYELNSYPFTYNAGETTIVGNAWLTFVTDDKYIKAYSKENCFKRTDGKKGLVGTFTNGAITITFGKKGKGTFISKGQTIDITYKNEAGIVSISDSGSSVKFYYLSDGSLLPEGALSTLIQTDKINLYVYMNHNEKGDAFLETMNSLPDGFYYELTQRAKTNDGNRADLVTVKTLLTQNPNKKFSISPGQLNTITYSHYDIKHYVTPIDEIPADWFKGCTNLYLFKFGDNLSTRIKVGSGAFSGCTNLKETWGSVSVKDFGENCFEGCSALENITFAKETTVKPNAFKDCSANLIVRKSNVSTVKVADDEAFTENVQDLSTETNLGALLTGTNAAKYWKFE